MRAVPQRGRLTRAAGRIFGLALCGLLAAHAPAQQGQQRSKNVWVKPTTVKTTPKNGDRTSTGSKPRNRPVTVRRAPLLTLQWMLIRFGDDGVRMPVSASETFSAQERLALAVKSNQNGYLYIIRQTADGADGQLLFPSGSYNGGKSDLKMNVELTLPSNCADFTTPCWFRLPPSASKEMLTLIFSRNPIKDLPNKVTAAGGAPVKDQLLKKLRAESEQLLERVPAVVRTLPTVLVANWVTNTNAERNDEIIETVTLNGPASGKPAGRAASNQ